MSESEAAAAATEPAMAFAAWDPVLLEQRMQGQLFATVDANVQAGIAAREPSVVDWCILTGFQQGHVLALYHLTHNALRFSRGRVPSVADVRLGAQFAALLLLRVAQDVTACKKFLARTDRDAIYRAFAGMVSHWLTRWRVGVLPTPGDVADALSAWLVRPGVTLPSPVWATCFELPYMGWCWDWGTPTAENKVALDIAEGVSQTRADVAKDFLAALRKADTWPTFLAQDFTKNK